MHTITTSKQVKIKEDLVIIPRKEYEKFLVLQKEFQFVKVFTPTATEKKFLKRARENFAGKKFINLKQLKYGLGINN